MSETRTFFCTTCKVRLQLVVLKTWMRSDDVDGNEGTQFFFGHCVECNRPGLLSHDFEPGPGDWDVSADVQLHPSIAPLANFAMPERVVESYAEAVKCESAGAWLATAVMVRRTLEAIGKEFAPQARSAFEALKAMNAQGVISEELTHWGNELRFLGNAGAHPSGDPVLEQDAREALEFLKVIAETIYHLRPKFKAMQERRSALRKSPPSKAPPSDSPKETNGDTALPKGGGAEGDP